MKFTAQKTIDLKETKPFISALQKDDPVEDQVIWHIRKTLTDKEKKILMNPDISSSITSTLCIHMVLLEVENLYHLDGSPFVLQRGSKTLGYGLTQKAIKESSMDVVFDEVQLEIYTHVSEEYFSITEEDVKNS